MKIVKPEPLEYGEGEKAVILLHSFTGTVRDVKPLGQHLEKAGYTVYIPSFEGHGMGPDALIRTGPGDWWENVLAAHRHLKERGHGAIAIGGVSLGGVLSLKAGEELSGINGVVAMSVPQGKDVGDINRRVLSYTRNFMKFTGAQEADIEEKVENLKTDPMKGLDDFEKLITRVHENLGNIYIPVAVKYGGKDAALYRESAEHIYENITHDDKEMMSYENTGHLMTRGRDQEELFSDIERFLDGLDWA